MRKNPVLATILSVMFLVLSVLSMIIPGKAGEITAMFLLPLFFVLLCGILTGAALPAAVGVISPLVAFLITGNGRFVADVLPFALALSGAGIMAGILYGRMRTVVGATEAALLFFVVLYGVAKMILMLAIAESYKATDFLGTIFVRQLPGVLLCAVGVPLVSVLLRQIGILKVLRD